MKELKPAILLKLLYRYFTKIYLKSEAYLESCQTSKMEYLNSENSF